MVKDFLEKLGFSQKETQVYLTLAQTGRMTASELSKVTKLNRTTVYGILLSLIKKQVVIEDLGTATSSYLPAPSSNLIEYFERKEREVRNQKELAIRVAGEVSRMGINQPFTLAKITFVDEADIESYILKRTERWCSTLQHYDGVWRGFQDSRLLELFPDYFKELYGRILPANIRQELVVEDLPAEVEFEKSKHDRRQVKIWEHGYDFTYSTWIVGDYVIMIQAKDRPFYLIELKDPLLAKNLREIFKGIWKFLG